MLLMCQSLLLYDYFLLHLQHIVCSVVSFKVFCKYRLVEFFPFPTCHSLPPVDLSKCHPHRPSFFFLPPSSYFFFTSTVFVPSLHQCRNLAPWLYIPFLQVELSRGDINQLYFSHIFGSFVNDFSVGAEHLFILGLHTRGIMSSSIHIF